PFVSLTLLLFLTPTASIYPLPLHDALPISATSVYFVAFGALGETIARTARKGDQLIVEARIRADNWTDKQGEKQYDHSFVVQGLDRKSTRLNSSHGSISYAVFCLRKKKYT